MGGEEATSEMAQMEDRLSQQLDDIQNQLSGIEDQMNGLSDEINASTNKIIAEMTTALDNAYAKQQLNDFMLVNGTHDFGYEQYRNYIYGTVDHNSMADTAYYAKLKESIRNNASDEIIKSYYDQLYTVLMDNRTAYRNYVLGTNTSKTIVQYYYDVVSSNPDLVADGMTSEIMATSGSSKPKSARIQKSPDKTIRQISKKRLKNMDFL